MGKGDSSTASTTKTESNSGANQVTGDDNISLSGVQGNISMLDGGAINDAFSFADESVNKVLESGEDIFDNTIGLAGDLSDNSLTLAERSFDQSQDMAAGQSNFLGGVMTKFLDANNTANKNAFEVVNKNSENAFEQVNSNSENAFEQVTSSTKNAFDSIGQVTKSIAQSAQTESTQLTTTALKLAAGSAVAYFAIQKLKG